MDETATDLENSSGYKHRSNWKNSRMNYDQLSNNKPKDKKIGPIATIIGSLSGILITIIATHAYYPPSIFLCMVTGLLLVIFLLIAFIFLVPPIRKFVKKRRIAKKHNALAKRYFGDFEELINRFAQFVEPRHCDNISYVLNDLQTKKPEFQDISPSVDQVRDIFLIFEKEAAKRDKNKDSLVFLVRWFEYILNLYNKQLICEPVKRIRAKVRAEIPEEIKEAYKQNRFVYDRFICDYVDLARKMNKTFGERITREYFETPQEL